MAVEIVFEVGGQRVRHPLDKDEIVIGRSPDNDVVINDPAISRKHARIFRDGEEWRVVDLGSKNGTRVNEQDGSDHALRNGDTIHLHTTVLTFQDGSAPTPASSARGASLKGTPDEAPSPAMQTVYRSAVDFSALAAAQPEAGSSATLDARVAGDRRDRLVTIVSETSRAILASKTLDETFQKVLDLVFDHLPVQRGFIMLWDEEQEDLVSRCVKHRTIPSGPDSEIQFSRTIAEKVYHERVAVLTLDAQIDERFAAGQSIAALGIRSAMAAPLWRGETVDGLLYVDTSLQSKAFDAFDLDLLSALGNHLAVAVEQSRLQRFVVEKEKLDRELAVAREIQIGTLPQTMPSFAGYEVAGLSRPADQTGGDTFDLVPLDGQRLMLLLGDATGHGIGPALSATQVRSMLRIALRLGADLDAAFVQINNQLAQDLASNRFVTGFLGELDGQQHRVRYHSGGQGPLMFFHCDRREFEWRGATCMPMGMMPQTSPTASQHFDFAAGDTLGLITDGVFEAENPTGEQFGRERVEQLMLQSHELPIGEIVQRLLDAVDEFSANEPQADDITIVMIRRLPG